MPDIFDILDTDVKGGDIFDQLDIPEESKLKSLGRTLYQIPSGIAQAATYPADILQLLGQGEGLNQEDIDHLREISEREGIPFDEEKYRTGVQKASESFPTQGNIERIIEEETGAPLTPRTKLQKGIKLGATAGKLTPGSLTKKAAASVTAPSISTGGQALGVPEPIADIAGLIGGAVGASKIPGELSIGAAKKPSGLTARQFEKLEKPRTVSEKRLEKINEKVESDFKDISDKIIKDSPIGKTYENLKNDPIFKQDSRELLAEAQQIADSLPGEYSTDLIKTEIKDLIASKKGTGFLPNDYDKSYTSAMRQMVKDTAIKDIPPSDWVKQYRKNNAALSEYYEPGQSKATNRGKRDALLDYNRAIANTMEKAVPDSELVPVFKEGNARWSKIMDVEAMDSFLEDIFSGKKIDFKKIHEFFDKEGYSRPFKRALGDKNFKEFETLMKDMLSSETPYKMLKIAKQKGFNDLFKTAGAYLIHPAVGKLKTFTGLGKGASKYLMDSLLDKPQLTITWKRAINNLKNGKFAQAEKDFSELDKEIKVMSKEEATKKATEKFNQKK